MQDKTPRRSNRDRTAATRAALLNSARALFVEKGYGATGTPEIVRRAKVTRGALYHHFDSKEGLFRAVVQAEARAVADEIARGTGNPQSALAALTRGTDIYFRAMTVPGRARLLLVDGPSILGPEAMNQIDRDTGGGELLEGLAHAARAGVLKNAPLAPLADILSAAMDRAALAVAGGAPAKDYRRAVQVLLDGLLD